jgi:transcriptional regulator with XRE-family HTH domain
MNAMTVGSPAQIGDVIRAVRKAHNMRLEDLALLAGVSKQTVQDIEHGKPTSQVGKVIVLLNNLGVQVKLVVPSEQRARVAEVMARMSQGQRDATGPTKRLRTAGT